MESDAKSHETAKMIERIAEESKILPYRWGYFQGAILFPWSLLILLGSASELLKPRHDPWYLLTIGFLMGFIGLPLGFGLLRKRKFALSLVYVMFGLTLLLVAIKIPMAIKDYTDPGDSGSAFFEAELLFVWLLSLLYYRRRQTQFR